MLFFDETVFKLRHNVLRLSGLFLSYYLLRSRVGIIPVCRRLEMLMAYFGDALSLLLRNVGYYLILFYNILIAFDFPTLRYYIHFGIFIIYICLYITDNRSLYSSFQVICFSSFCFAENPVNPGYSV